MLKEPLENHLWYLGFSGHNEKCLLLLSSDSIPLLHLCQWYKWVFMSHFFQKGAGVTNTVIQHMTCHAAVTDTLKISVLSHDTISSLHTRFKIDLFSLCEALCPQSASTTPLWLSIHLSRNNILYLFLDQIPRPKPISKGRERFQPTV